jgi:hypothetical protein
MDIWKIESNPGKQTLIAWIILVVGLILVIGFRNFDGSSLTNSLAGFLLGLLLLLIGFAVLLMGGKRSITVDPQAHRILIEDENRFRQRKRSISFDEVGKVYVSRLGNREGGSISYDVVLKLKAGDTVSLFRPAYFDGTWSRSVMEDRCRRLQEYIQRQEKTISSGFFRHS